MPANTVLDANEERSDEESVVGVGCDGPVTLEAGTGEGMENGGTDMSDGLWRELYI